MATLLADTYYLKAYDNYPYELAEVLENLNYTLSYDSDHPAANCLMGQLQLHYLKDYTTAESYFEAALVSDPEFVCAYEYLFYLYLNEHKLIKAQRILDRLQMISSTSPSFVLWGMARIMEIREQYKIAKHYLKVALTKTYSKDEVSFLKEELDRLSEKMRAVKKLK